MNLKNLMFLMNHYFHLFLKNLMFLMNHYFR